MPNKHSTTGEAARRGWHHNAGDTTNIKWLHPTWASCLYNKDRTNRRCSIPRWQGPALGLLQFPVSFPQQKGALGPLHGGSAWSVGAQSKPGGFGHSQAECCIPLGWPWALPRAFMDLTELHLPCGWSHSDSPPAASPGSRPPGTPKPAPHPGGSSLRAQGLCEHTHVCERRDLSTLRGYLQTTRNRTGTYCISSFAHRFLLQRLQAWALHLTPQEKSSLLENFATR